MTAVAALIIGIHALIAWILIEIFVNNGHTLSRAVYVLWHYIVVVAAFAFTFWVYYNVFHLNESVFTVTMTGLSFILLFELVVFRYLYAGERWFLNFTDWMFPMFLATTTMYVVGYWLM